MTSKSITASSPRGAIAARPSPFKQAARDLIARGFHVVPIEPGKKSPGEKFGSKHRPMSKWQDHGQRLPKDIEMEVWEGWEDFGIGIVLGGRVGDAQVIAVDIDIVDPDAVQDVLAALPYTPMAKVGRKGQTNFYRASPDMRTKQYRDGKTMLAEILTGNETRQTVVPPSIHPDTGKPYRWVAGATGVRATDLPMLTADDLTAFEETLEQHGWDRKGERKLPRGIAAGAATNSSAGRALDDRDSPYAALNAEAIANLDGWVPHLGLYRLERARGGYRCVATWRAGGTGRPDSERKLNLSIQPSGIKDFGDGRTYSAIDLVMAAAGRKAGDAYAWLDEALRGSVPDNVIALKDLTLPPDDLGAGKIAAPSVQQAVPKEDIVPPSTRRSGRLPDLQDPTPLVRDLPVATPYPLHALGPLRAVVEGIEDMMQCPPALAANSVLSVAALAAQGLANVLLLHGQASPLSLFLLTVGESGERKSAVDRLTMKPVRAWEEKLNREYQDKLQAHRNKVAIREEVEKGIRKRAHKSPDSARIELDQLGDEPLPPVLPYIIVSEPTVEGLTKQLALSRPSMGLFSDEGGAFIGGFSMNDENRLRTSAALSKFWDGDPIDRVRGGDGVLKLYGRRLALHLLAQPLAVGSLLGDPVANGQGLLARFLITHPESTIGTRTRLSHKESSDAALEEFHRRVSELICKPFPLAVGSQNELELEALGRDASAWSALAEFHIETELAMTAGGRFETVRPFASKAAEHAARIAGVLTVYAGAAEIDGETMSDAIELTRFYLEENLRLTGGASVSIEIQMAERLRRWLTGEATRSTAWDEDFISIRVAMRLGPIRGGDAAGMRKLFGVLQEFGWLTPADGGANVGGRHCRDAWRIVRLSQRELPLAS